MARIKDFAKDLGLDIKETVELIASYGLGTKQSSGNIDDGEIAIFLNKYTLEKQFSGIDSYFNGEAIIKSAKKKAAPKKEEPKTEAPAPEKKAEVKEEKPAKAEQKPEAKAEVKAEAKAEVKAEVKTEKPAEKKPEIKAEKPAEKKAEIKADKPVEAKNDKFNRDARKPFEKPQGQNKYQGRIFYIAHTSDACGKNITSRPADRH